MSDTTEAIRPRDWRGTCGRIGWAVLALVATLCVTMGIRIFFEGVGLALGGGMSVEYAEAVMLGAEILLGVIIALIILAVAAGRWGLLAATLPLLLVVFVFSNGRLTTAS